MTREYVKEMYITEANVKSSSMIQNLFRDLSAVSFHHQCVTDPTVRQPQSLLNRFRAGGLHILQIGQVRPCLISYPRTIDRKSDVVDRCPSTKFEDGLQSLNDVEGGTLNRLEPQRLHDTRDAKRNCRCDRAIQDLAAYSMDSDNIQYSGTALTNVPNSDITLGKLRK